MPRVVLLGDSILDNATYTRGGPDVVSQVRELLRPEWGATLLAVDGSTTDHVQSQLARLPKDATHLVLSVGGNNALMHLGMLDSPVSSMAKSIEALADIASDFEARYRVVIAACLNTGLPWPFVPSTTAVSKIGRFNASLPRHSRCSTTSSFESRSSTPFPCDRPALGVCQF